METETALIRYLAIVRTDCGDEGEEAVILGFHCSDSSAQLGMVLPINQSTEVTLDGDGWVLTSYPILTRLLSLPAGLYRPKCCSSESLVLNWMLTLSFVALCPAVYYTFRHVLSLVSVSDHRVGRL